MRRSASFVRGSEEDNETEHFSFLDLLCCGLGGAVLLFLIFVDFGSRVQPTVKAPTSIFFDVRWSGDKKVAVDLLEASNGNGLLTPAESTTLDLMPLTTSRRGEIKAVVVFRLDHAAGIGSGPGAQEERRAFVAVSGEKPDLANISLGLRFVSSNEMEKRYLKSDVEDLKVSVKRFGLSLAEAAISSCDLPFGVHCVVRPGGDCSCIQSP